MLGCGHAVALHHSVVIPQSLQLVPTEQLTRLLVIDLFILHRREREEGEGEEEEREGEGERRREGRGSSVGGES